MTRRRAGEWPEITDARVNAAFERVPRDEFVEPGLRKWADRDAPLPIAEGQTISQPFVVALMVQALDLAPGATVLEIGTGSGFQTAILCELVVLPGQMPGATVYSVERFESLHQTARSTLTRLGYRPHFCVGDGAAGWQQAAPFAAIVVSAAPSYAPRPLWDQLAEGGRMVLPVGPSGGEQELWLFVKRDGQPQRTRMGPVRFVPMVTPLLDDPAMRMAF